MTDEELMQRYRDGDAQAFDDLYGRYRGPVYRYVTRLLGAGHDIDGIVQDCWLRVIHRRDSWTPGSPFRAWLFRIAHNRAVDVLRSCARSPVDAAANVSELPDRRHAVEQWQFIRDCIERLLRLLAELPAAQRNAFLLKEEAGLSLQDIAEVSKVGRETVKSRLRYAVGALRRGLEGCEHA
jgi:RNA polymerase sigma-70 factor (ECF subfamily)